MDFKLELRRGISVVCFYLKLDGIIYSGIRGPNRYLHIIRNTRIGDRLRAGN